MTQEQGKRSESDAEASGYVGQHRPREGAWSPTASRLYQEQLAQLGTYTYGRRAAGEVDD